MASSKPASRFSSSADESNSGPCVTDIHSVIEVPEEYVIPNQEYAISDGTSLAAIPTIDMTQLDLVNQPPNNNELEKLHSACKEWGFFQLINHGVSSELLEKLNQELEKFFTLPLEEKLRYEVKPGDVEGYGIFIKSNETKLEWGIRFFMITNPINRRKPHLFPELPTSMRTTLESFMLELQRIAGTLLGLMATLLNVTMEEMEELFADGLQTVRMTHYPPCPNPELVVGIKPHSDGSGITILHQANDVQGLQIKKDGVWFPVSLDPDGFVINVGDILEILTNGLYQSMEHRVTVNSGKERISIAMFFMPKPGTEMKPLTSLRDAQKPPSSINTGMEKFSKKYLSHYFSMNGEPPLEQTRAIPDGEDEATA